MSRLAQLLDDVLAGRRVIRDAKTFALLRRFAPEKAIDLDRLEAESVRRTSVPVENGADKSASLDKVIYLTRDDLKAIVHHGRPATIDELEWLLAHAGDRHLLLSTTEELALRNLAARLLAKRHLADVQAFEPADDFIARTLGTIRTKYGDIARAEVAQLERIRLQAVHAIQDCREHKTERCSCWKSAREALFELRCGSGEGSPVAMSALAVWNSIEALARDRPPQLRNAEQDEGPPGIVYNWRYYKCPDYVTANYQTD